MLLIKRAALPRPLEGALELLAEQFVPPWLDCGTSRRIRETEAEATAFCRVSRYGARNRIGSERLCGRRGYVESSVEGQS